MKNKKLVIPTIALLGVTALAGSSVYALEQGERSRPVLTEEQKETLEEIKELKAEGNYEEAKALAEESGIHLMKKHKTKKEIREFVDAEDYESFAEAIKDRPIAEIVDTEEKFQILVQAHELRQGGNHEEAKELMESIGLEKRSKNNTTN